MILGIDVGGANIKAASSDTSFSKTIYAPLWENKDILYEVLADIKKEVKSKRKRIEAIVVVMTGELCDCFKTKKEGILYIENAINDIFEKEHPKFFSAEGIFENSDIVKENPFLFSSTNWLASAKLISKKWKNAIFADVGSTTTDVIPMVEGEIKAKKTDFERLKRGELIYSGVLRTNVACLLKKVKIGGEEYRTSSELFAITADAYLILGCIKKDNYTCESPNSYVFGKGEKEKKEEKNKINAMHRLSRVICCDLEDIGEKEVINIAKQVKNVQIKELCASIKAFKEKYGLRMVVSAGIGDFLAKEAATLLNLDFLPLSSIYGSNISNVFPAYAVAKLLEEEKEKQKLERG